MVWRPRSPDAHPPFSTGIDLLPSRWGLSLPSHGTLYLLNGVRAPFDGVRWFCGASGLTVFHRYGIEFSIIVLLWSRPVFIQPACSCGTTQRHRKNGSSPAGRGAFLSGAQWRSIRYFHFSFSSFYFFVLFFIHFSLLSSMAARRDAAHTRALLAQDQSCPRQTRSTRELLRGCEASQSSLCEGPAALPAH
jgi:hypothetical protein